MGYSASFMKSLHDSIERGDTPYWFRFLLLSSLALLMTFFEAICVFTGLIILCMPPFAAIRQLAPMRDTSKCGTEIADPGDGHYFQDHQ
jgi:hypothetical protein